MSISLFIVVVVLLCFLSCGCSCCCCGCVFICVYPCVYLCLFSATYVKKEDREAEKRLGKKTGYFNSKPWTFYGQGVDRRICQECSGICCNALKDLVGRLVEEGFLIPGAHSPTVGCCCLIVGLSCLLCRTIRTR